MRSPETNNKVVFKDESEKTLESLGLVKQLVLASDVSLVPKNLTYEEDPSAIIDPSYFARRIALLTHELKESFEDTDLETHQERVTLENLTSERIFLTGKDLDSKYQKTRVLEKDYVLLALDPKQKISFTLTFERGSALENAKFCTLGKLGFEFERPPYGLTCTSIRRIEDHLSDTKALIKEILEDEEKE